MLGVWNAGDAASRSPGAEGLGERPRQASHLRLSRRAVFIPAGPGGGAIIQLERGGESLCWRAVNNPTSSKPASPAAGAETRPPLLARPWVLATLLLVAVLGGLFLRSLAPQFVVHSNDGPLGGMAAQQNRLPAILTGLWQDLNWLGSEAPTPSPTLSTALRLVTTPVGFSKLFCPFSLLVLGLSAAFCFRQLRLSPLASILGGLATALNSTYFSTACWGVASQMIALAMNFVALGLLANPSGPRWLKLPLAGMAVGMGVMEGYDIGAIFSVVVAAFVVYQGWHEEGPAAKRLGLGLARVIVVAAFAGFMAAQAVTTLVGTQIKGVVGMQQDAATKERRWNEATQWSLPKREALGLFIPGLFGYRMDTPDGGGYWGAAGRDAAWDQYFAGGMQGQPPDPNSQFLRYTGGGNYAGVLVVLVAVWAGIQALRREGSVFSLESRRLLWFWIAALVIALLLAFGRYAPFYRLLYALPYFSTIRNPAKFIHVFNWALVILFAYGVHGLSRRYLEMPGAATPLLAHLKKWWAQVRGFDRKWTLGVIAACSVGLLGWLIYSSSRNALEAYLQQVLFDPESAKAIASFSIGQTGWFVLLLLLGAGALTLVISGYFAGARAKWGGILLGVLLVGDLGWANQPWIIYWDYQQKYATNPVIDFLREKPYEHRVAILPKWLPYAFKLPKELVSAEGFMGQLYGAEWAQHLFLYYNIQSLDIIQMPRVPEDMAAFESALQFRGTADTLPLVARRWELTNTRYLLGATPMVDLLNKALDPAAQRFKTVLRFDLVPKPGVTGFHKLEELTAVPATNGNFAVFEFTGALPRASLYSHWQVSTNDTATLAELAKPEFDPFKTVLVAGGVPAAPPAAATNAAAGTVQFVSYAPKRIQLKTQAEAPAVLLLNDKYDPNWQVRVDGQPATLLRCNYVMRGVYLTPGPHTVEFRFRPPVGALYLSLAAIAAAVVMVGLLALLGSRHQPVAETTGGPVKA